MRFYKIIGGGYIISIGTGKGGTEITEASSQRRGAQARAIYDRCFGEYIGSNLL